VEGLGKEINQLERGQAVGGQEPLQVAGQRGRVAGKIDQARRGQLQQRVGDLAAEPGARRVEHGGVALLRRALEKLFDTGSARLDARCVGDVGGQVGGGVVARLDRDHALELFRQRAGEEADAGVEVERNFSFEAVGDALDQRWQQMAVDLKKAAVADAQAVPADLVVNPTQPVVAAALGGGFVELDGEQAIELGAQQLDERGGVEVEARRGQRQQAGFVAVVGEGFDAAEAERELALLAEPVEDGEEPVELG